MVQFLHRVAHLVCHTVHGILGSYHNDAVAHLQAQMAVGKQVHVATAHTGHIHAINAGEVQFCQCLAVHLGLCHQYMLAHHGHILFCPFHFCFGAYEGNDGLGIVLGTVNEHLVAYVYYGVPVGHAHMAVVQDTAAHEVAGQELAYLQDCAAFQGLVRGHYGHAVWGDMRVGGNLLLYLLLLLLQRGAGKQAYQYRCAYNAHYAKGIGAGITVGYLWRIRTENGAACLGGGTQARGVGDGSAQYAHHHGQRTAVLAGHAVPVVKYQEEQTYAAEHVQQYYAHCQHVHRHASLLETFKETRSHLQTYAVDKEYQTEVLYEGQCGAGACQTEVSCQNAGKQHECYSQ